MRGMTQADLARALGKSDATVNKWARGITDPSDTNRADILRALNAPVENGEQTGPFFTQTDLWGVESV